MADDKSVANLVIKENGDILIRGGRLSYEHIFTPWAKNPAEEKLKYSARLILPKSTHLAAIKALKARCEAQAMEWFKGKLPSAHIFIRNGDDTGKEEMADCWYIQASETKKPQTINADKSEVTEADDIIYSGCFVNMLIRPWKQDNKWGKRVNANLLAVQFRSDGERFTSRDEVDVDETFDDESGGVAGAASNDDGLD